MTSSILAFSDSGVDGRTTWAVVGEGDDGEGVVGLELLDGGEGGLLDAAQAADAGAVFLVHRAADVEDQGEVEGERLAGAAAGRDELDERVAGGGLARDRDAAAVHHALDVDLGCEDVGVMVVRRLHALGRGIDLGKSAAEDRMNGNGINLLNRADGRSATGAAMDFADPHGQNDG